MLNNLSLTANLVWATFESLILLGAGVKFFFTIKSRLDNIENYTYKRNGGSSMADALARLEKALKENTKVTQDIAVKLAKLEGKFEQHVDEQNG
jgi:hypothetical protein